VPLGTARGCGTPGSALGDGCVPTGGLGGCRSRQCWWDDSTGEGTLASETANQYRTGERVQRRALRTLTKYSSLEQLLMLKENLLSTLDGLPHNNAHTEGLKTPFFFLFFWGVEFETLEVPVSQKASYSIAGSRALLPGITLNRPREGFSLGKHSEILIF